ncbi:hypothetical protein [Burkholderia anthina]|uniref:hypothetical protein n=1 Tax=Burkholderia anthina TaxID=179879 RepID=UPI001AA04172|nr:hypothetical protein [Burkholderia anthina]QTD88916.1 hypothetical protein J4G50_13975 [Burkholderia anthina]
MKNIAELRNELSAIFEGLRAGKLAAKDAVELNNTAGKIIATCKVELAHRVLTQDSTPIPFLDTNTGAMKTLADSVTGKTVHKLEG